MTPTSGATAPLAIHRTTRWSTSIEVVVTDPGAVVAAAGLLGEVLDDVEIVASRFREDSEISHLCRAGGNGPVPVSEHLFEALTIALRASQLTDGIVDPTVGSALCRLGYDRDLSEVVSGVNRTLPEPAPVPGWRSIVVDADARTVDLPAGCVLDLGATAKAWAADQASARIGARLGCGVLVSLGGDIATHNAPAGGFTVALADICGDPDAPVAVSVGDGGLASSGVGKRFWDMTDGRAHHLIDPATGLPATTCWRTVTVAAGTCVDANTASTAAMILGEAAPAWLSTHGLPSRLVHTDGTVTTVVGWPEDEPRPSDRISA